MTKSNNFQQGGFSNGGGFTGDRDLKRGVYSGNRRWNASRMEGAVKNKGNRMVRKSKKG
jgi:hypothetical protein